MNCVITSANIFSGQSAVTSRIFPVQSAVSVRKPTPDRPFVCPILQLMFSRSPLFATKRDVMGNDTAKKSVAFIGIHRLPLLITVI